MNKDPNYRLVATKIGEALKYDTTLNEIGRTAQAIFKFKKEEFPNDHITSERSQEVYDWVLSLAKQRMSPNERNNILLDFCRELFPSDKFPIAEEILKEEWKISQEDCFNILSLITFLLQKLDSATYYKDTTA